MTAIFDLKGKQGLIVGVANERSIAWGCAGAMHAAGARLAMTYLNAKAEPHVRPLAESVGAELILPLDVEADAQMEQLFEGIAAAWGRLDFVVHSVAYAPKADLHGRIVDCSREGFARAMDISCHSFIRLARHAEPLMDKGGTLLTMSYLGAEKVVPNYGLMGPVKAALESTTRYLAAELGPAGIRALALSPGPVPTRAASGIAEFDRLSEEAARRAPLRRLTTIEEVGALAAFLVSDQAASMTGETIGIDAGYQILA